MGYRYNTRELKDDERFDTWFDFVNGANLTYKKLIGTGRLLWVAACAASAAAGHPLSLREPPARPPDPLPARYSNVFRKAKNV